MRKLLTKDAVLVIVLCSFISCGRPAYTTNAKPQELTGRWVMTHDKALTGKFSNDVWIEIATDGSLIYSNFPLVNEGWGAIEDQVSGDGRWELLAQDPYADRKKQVIECKVGSHGIQIHPVREGAEIKLGVLMDVNTNEYLWFRRSQSPRNSK